jgi:hypothetical protein
LLVAERSQTQQENQRSESDSGQGQQTSFGGGKAYARQDHQQGRSGAKQQQMAEQRPGQQLGGLACIGFQDVDNHGPVDDHAERVGKIADGGRGQQQQNEERLKNGSEGEQRDHQVQQQDQGESDRAQERPVLEAVQTEPGDKRAPEEMIVRQHDKQGCQQGDGCRPEQGTRNVPCDEPMHVRTSHGKEMADMLPTGMSPEGETKVKKTSKRRSYLKLILKQQPLG